MIDLNCDMGELDDAAHEAALMEHITSANIACGAHAGNDATMRPFMPAAFARGPGGAAGGVELLTAIGARNAAGLTTAAFSNWGEWVTAWAPGNALVSTVPVWEGAATGGLALLDAARLGPDTRTGPDPDDLRSGFAVWAGTSFATPVVAGILANALTKEAVCGAADTLDRARRALKALHEELVHRHWKLPPVSPKHRHEEISTS